MKFKKKYLNFRRPLSWADINSHQYIKKKLNPKGIDVSH